MSVHRPKLEDNPRPATERALLRLGLDTHQNAPKRDRPKQVRKSTQEVRSATGQIRAHDTRNALLVRWYRLTAGDVLRAILAGAWACNSRAVTAGVTALGQQVYSR